MLEFQKQDCSLTLQEGLDIYYNAFEDQESILRGDTKTDIIFGVPMLSLDLAFR
jgi:hypothetical protein